MSHDGIPSTIAAARDYIDRGLRVVPIPPRKKSPKQPGWPDLKITPETVANYFGDKSNIGLILGEPSGWLVDVDLDCEEACQLAEDYLPPTSAISGRGNRPRSHYWYFAEGAQTAKHKDPQTGQMIVELRSTGLQTVVGPSVHPAGDFYDMLDGEPAAVKLQVLTACVEALAKAVIRQRYGEVTANPQTVTTRPRTYEDPSQVERRAIAYLETLPSAISGQGGHNATYTAAVALVHGFGLNTDQALGLLLAHYNPRCDPPWEEPDLRHKVDDAAAKSHDKPYGWLRDAESNEQTTDVDLSGILNGCQPRHRSPPPSEPRDPGPFPESLLHVPGFLDEIMKHNLMTAHRPQPVLALGAAIALLAALTGRKVCDDTDSRTNIYCLGVCPSGMGKEHARQLNKDILYLAGAQHLIGPEGLASHAGLISAVEQQPAILFQLDEIGRLLRTLCDASHSPHLFHVATNLMKLYTSSNTLYVGDAYADSKRNKIIHQPHACVYATTSPRWLYEGLTAESISDGFLSRIMLLEAEHVPKQRKTNLPIPEGIIETTRWWADYNPGGNLTGEHPAPRIIPADEAAMQTFDDLDDLADEEQLRWGESLGTLWTRATEKARKFALIFACSENREEPQMGMEAATWACRLSRYLTERMVYLAGQWIAENPYDAKRKRVLRLITSKGPRGLSRSELYAKTRALTTRERSEIIEALLLCDDIRTQHNQDTGGAPCTRFIASQFSTETS